MFQGWFKDKVVGGGANRFLTNFIDILFFLTNFIVFKIFFTNCIDFIFLPTF